MRDRLKKYYPLETSIKKMDRIYSYYSKRPPVRPNYWILKQKKIMTDNVRKQRVMFVIKSNSKSLKFSSKNTNSSNSKRSSPKKNDNILFTDSFRQQLNRPDDNFSSKNLLLLFYYFVSIWLSLIEALKEEIKEIDWKPTQCHSRSSISRTPMKKSFKLEELLVDESLISRKNEEILVKSVRKLLGLIIQIFIHF